MKIALVTNMVSHHQLPFARSIARQIGGDNFRYIATGEVSAERIRMGWTEDLSDSWVIKLSDVKDFPECMDWLISADVVISGELIFDVFEKRVGQGLLTFYMSERWWKPKIGLFRLLNPPHLIRAIKYKKLSKSKYFGYLSIGDRAAQDLDWISFSDRKIWRWGYFTENNILEREDCEGSKLNILWAGRIISLKRLDLLILAVSELIKTGLKVNLTIIGDGPQKNFIQKLSSDNIPAGGCVFMPAMPAPEVYKYMCRSDIFVLPSNGYEGWGAVVNEAMSAGCAVVASDAAGAALSIIKSGENGFLFKSGDIVDLRKKLEIVCIDADLRKKISDAAVRSINEIWSPHVAAERFISVCVGEHHGNKKLYDSGPMEAL